MDTTGMDGEWKTITIPACNQRIDSALSTLLSISRSRVQQLIEQDFVLLENVPVKSNRKVDEDIEVRIFFPKAKSLDLVAQDIPLEVLYQDDHLAIIEKPAGLVVHPAVGHEDGTLVNALLHHLGDLSKGGGIAGTLRPGIVHRIDKETSGILVVTKTDLAHESLSEQFQKHTIVRKYEGLCWGDLPNEGLVDQPIARDSKDRKRMAVVESGKRAVTKFRKIQTFHRAITHFEAELFTGRTHQIRVHFSFLGHPLVGDSTYGSASRSARKTKDEGRKVIQKKLPDLFAKIEELENRSRQVLHAKYLEFTHPESQVRMKFTSALPLDIKTLLEKL